MLRGFIPFVPPGRDRGEERGREVKGAQEGPRQEEERSEDYQTYSYCVLSA